MNKLVAQENGRGLPPYLPYTTLDSFIGSVKIALPSRIDRSVLPNMSGTMQGQLLAALTFLNLINSDGIPTEKLKAYVRSEGEERQKILKDILVASYPFLYENFDLKHATASQLSERFSDIGTSGDTTRKCIRFFLKAAEDAKIEFSPHFSNKKRAGRVIPSKGKHRQPRERVESITQDADNHAPRGNSGDPSIDKLLLAKFPEFDPSWSDEVKIKWFDGFNRLRDDFKK
jgi:hypothetical protein